MTRWGDKVRVEGLAPMGAVASATRHPAPSTPLVGWAEARKRCRRLKPYENAHMQGFAYHFLHSIVSEKKFSTSKTLHMSVLVPYTST